MPKPSFTIGIEEEYQTVDPETRDLRSHIHTEILTRGKRVMAEKIKSEMHQSVVEVGTGVCRTIKEARQDYRKGALEARDRRVVRVWLRADMLFTTNTDGQEVLTDAGRSRLESAMSEFLTHPSDSPIVVEGYAPGATYDARYIASRRRASLVREYLVARIQLDMSRTGVMAMGDQAPGSPANGTWDGIAIAVFLRTSK